MSSAGDVLLDTSIIVDYIRGDDRLRPHVAAAATICCRSSCSANCTSVSSGRRGGSMRSVRFANSSRIATLLLPDENTAEQYGQVKADLARNGRPIPENEVWIAATAIQHDLPVATRDAHFAVVPRLKTLAW